MQIEISQKISIVSIDVKSTTYLLDILLAPKLFIKINANWSKLTVSNIIDTV